MADGPGKRGPDKRARGRLAIKEVETALRNNAGVQAPAADALNVSRSALNRFVKKHHRLQVLICDLTEELSDLAEGQLLIALKAGEPWAVRYFLDNRGQARGYGIRKLAFRDGEGQMAIAAVLVTPPQMTPEQWDAEFGDGGKPMNLLAPPTTAAE